MRHCRLHWSIPGQELDSSLAPKPGLVRSGWTRCSAWVTNRTLGNALTMHGESTTAPTHRMSPSSVPHRREPVSTIESSSWSSSWSSWSSSSWSSWSSWSCSSWSSWSSSSWSSWSSWSDHHHYHHHDHHNYHVSLLSVILFAFSITWAAGALAEVRDAVFFQCIRCVWSEAMVSRRSPPVVLSTRSLGIGEPSAIQRSQMSTLKSHATVSDSSQSSLYQFLSSRIIKYIQ